METDKPMFLDNFLDKFSLLDWFGLGWFLLCWLGYEVVVERGWIGRKSLLLETHRMRQEWGRVMLTREPRIVEEAQERGVVDVSEQVDVRPPHRQHHDGS